MPSGRAFDAEPIPKRMVSLAPRGRGDARVVEAAGGRHRTQESPWIAPSQPTRLGLADGLHEGPLTPQLAKPADQIRGDIVDDCSTCPIAHADGRIRAPGQGDVIAPPGAMGERCAHRVTVTREPRLRGSSSTGSARVVLRPATEIDGEGGEGLRARDDIPHIHPLIGCVRRCALTRAELHGGDARAGEQSQIGAVGAAVRRR